MKGKSLLICVAILLISAPLCAQQYLVLYKSGAEKRYYYPTGSIVKLKLKEEKAPFTASIDALEPTYFLSGLDTIHFAAIDHLYLPEPERAPEGAQVLGKLLTYAGFGIVALDLINQGIVNDEPFRSNTGLWIAGVSIGTLGLLPRLIKRRKRKVKGMWKIQVRDSKI